MMFRILTAAGFGLLALAAPAAAQSVNTYPYPAAANYCPHGLQPVAVGGDISCGVPDQAQTYDQMKRHPVQRRSYRPTYRRIDPELYGSKSPGGY
ncbi:hypothetical protein ACX9MO_03840 [Pseudooceanicola sp. 502str34]